MKVGIVTGASSGMGREFVGKLLSQREDLDELWLIARRRERMEVWEKQYPECAFRFLTWDLAREETMEALDRLLEETRPEVTCFIHSAGIGKTGAIEDLPGQEAGRMVDLNCRSVVTLTTSVLPYLTGDARMIYMASAAAFMPQAGFGVYAATKAFVLSYVRALRAEQSHTDRKITAVCPGAVKTEFLDLAMPGKQLPFYKKMVLADPSRVVDKAWRDNGRGREMSVYGPLIRLTQIAAKLVPHRFFLAITKKTS